MPATLVEAPKSCKKLVRLCPKNNPRSILLLANLNCPVDNSFLDVQVAVALVGAEATVYSKLSESMVVTRNSPAYSESVESMTIKFPVSYP